MKAIGKLYPKPGIEIFETEEPKPSTKEVLIEVKVASICGTDLHFYNWDKYAQHVANKEPNFFPHILGHEISGLVIEIGDDVKNLKKGDKVAIETHIPCTNCYYCRTGNMHICQDLKIFGIHVNGGFTKYVTVPDICAVKIPNSISFEIGAILEPFGVAVHAVDEADIHPGDSVVVLGSGPIGLMTQMLVKNSSASLVVAVDINEYRLDLSRNICNVDAAINPRNEDIIEKIFSLTENRGADIVIDLTGSPDAVIKGLKILRQQGKMVLAGIYAKPIIVDATDLIVHKEIKIKGISGRKMFNTWYRAIKILQSKKIDIDPLITHKYRFNQYKEAFETYNSRSCGKVLLYID